MGGNAQPESLLQRRPPGAGAPLQGNHHPLEEALHVVGGVEVGGRRPPLGEGNSPTRAAARCAAELAGAVAHHASRPGEGVGSVARLAG